MNVKQKAVSILRANYETEIQKHVMHVELFLSNYTGVAEHIDITATLEEELDKISTLMDRISVLDKHFT